jgi:transposase
MRQLQIKVHDWEESKTESLAQFFRVLEAGKCKSIKSVLSDMWRNNLDVVQDFLPYAIHVLAAFRVVK